MEIVNMKIEDLKPYEKNPRKNNEAVKYVKESIQKFGFKVPIVLDKNNVIVAGHTRYKASLELGLEEVPCIIADDLTDEQVKAFRLADNKVSEKAEWDFDLLNEELNDILDISMPDFGFDLSELEEDINIDDIEDNTNRFSTETKIPQYDIEGIDVSYNDMLDLTKYNELISEIENADISDDEKMFLTLSATRHIKFNYKNIAEFYAKSTTSKEVQRLMEKSALVFIDFNDAIANGYVQLSKKINEAIGEENE